MDCPICHEGILHKICFLKSKKLAYLCDSCRRYWLNDEHVSEQTGHVLDTTAYTESVPEIFTFLKEKDMDEEAVKDEKERIMFEISHS